MDSHIKPTKRRRKTKALLPEFPVPMKTGLCPFCFYPILADQPGGLNPRHESGIPYRLCDPALKVDHAW